MLVRVSVSVSVCGVFVKTHLMSEPFVARLLSVFPIQYPNCRQHVDTSAICLNA